MKIHHTSGKGVGGVFKGAHGVVARLEAVVVEAGELAARLKAEAEAAIAEPRRRVARGSASPATKPEPVTINVGDDATTPVLRVAVEAAIRDRPLYLQELVELTGARRNRISGVLAKLREGGVAVNLGNRRAARWFAPDASVLERLSRR